MMEDIECAPAPAPAPHEESAKTMIIERGGRGSLTTRVVVSLLLLLVLIGGVAFTLVKRIPDDGVSSASAEVTTKSDDAAETVTLVAVTGDAPEDCVGSSTDPQRHWYCDEFLPFAKKASADHSRIDRLEAASKDTGGSDTPLGLWLLAIGGGILSVYNTVKIHSRKEKPPTG